MKTLPEITIGRAGYDLFSSRKELTIIMIPFERFSCFMDAVDHLYQTVNIPFNLIVVAGNAPESVRQGLEKRQRRHKNIAILYSNHQVSTGAAINLATPHLRTQYAFIMDNDVRVSGETISRMLKCAKEKKSGIVLPKNYMTPSQLNDLLQTHIFQNAITMRTSFLVSQEAIRALGKLDDNLSSFTIGISLSMMADEKGIPICADPTCVECEVEHPVLAVDESLYSFQWSEKRLHESLGSLEKKLGIHFSEEEYVACLKKKKKELADSRRLQAQLVVWASKLKAFSYQRLQKRIESFLVVKPI